MSTPERVLIRSSRSRRTGHECQWTRRPLQRMRPFLEGGWEWRGGSEKQIQPVVILEADFMQIL